MWTRKGEGEERGERRKEFYLAEASIDDYRIQTNKLTQRVFYTSFQIAITDQQNRPLISAHQHDLFG